MTNLTLYLTNFHYYPFTHNLRILIAYFILQCRFTSSGRDAPYVGFDHRKHFYNLLTYAWSYLAADTKQILSYLI